MMLPAAHNKLQMQRRGPYVVAERVRHTDFRIDFGSQTKVYNINKLKQYFERAESVRMTAKVLEDTDNEDPGVSDHARPEVLLDATGRALVRG